MNKLQYDIVHSNSANTWYDRAYAEIYFTVEYDAATNRSTVTFDKCYHHLWGDSNREHHSWGTITVTAADSGDSATSAMDFTGDTDGSSRIVAFECMPDPVSISVQHSGTIGEKEIIISGDSDAWPVYVNGNDHGLEGHGSITVNAGDRQGMVSIEINNEWKQFSPYIDTGSGWKPCVPYRDTGTGWEICN